MLFKPIGTASIPAYWFAVCSVTCPHFIDLISHLSYSFILKMSLFACKAVSRVSEKHNAVNHRCENLKHFKLIGFSVMKQIAKQPIGVNQHKPYVIISLHEMQEV